MPHLGTPHELLVTWPTAPLGGDDLTALLAYARRLASVPGVARVTSPEDAFPGDPARAVSAMLATDEAGAALRGLFVQGDTARLAVLSSFAVDDERSLEQLELLRSVAPPPGTRVLVGGQPALLQTSTGLCLSAEQIPQGPPTVTVNQSRVIAT